MSQRLSLRWRSVGNDLRGHFSSADSAALLPRLRAHGRYAVRFSWRAGVFGFASSDTLLHRPQCKQRPSQKRWPLSEPDLRRRSLPCSVNVSMINWIWLSSWAGEAGTSCLTPHELQLINITLMQNWKQEDNYLNDGPVSVERDCCDVQGKKYDMLVLITGYAV